MSQLDRYIAAADRDNTRKSYSSALRHFELEWKGLLPATTDSIARYLTDYAPTLSINTLKHRLSALSRWHAEHGFADPTRSVLVRQVLRGIRALHPAQEKQARPLQIEALQQVSAWLERAISLAQSQADHPRLLCHARNQALLLLGFWRGFRADELVHLRIENVEVIAGEGLRCYLPRSKGDRQLEGRYFQCPALSRLCPVAAFEAWIALSGLQEGPVFRKIDCWGHLGTEGLAPNSLIPLLRQMFAKAGVTHPEDYSSHSLRRGFAGWAHVNGWDLKDLMAYVGWKDIKSAMRYLDGPDAGLQARFERGLATLEHNGALTDPVTTASTTPDTVGSASEPAPPTALVRVSLALTRFSKSVRGLTQAQRLIEGRCLERYAMQRLNKAGTEYELGIPYPSREALDDTIYTLLDEMHQIADNNHCFLEITVYEKATDTHWD